MRGDGSALQQPRPGEEECPRTDGGDAPRAPGGAAYPADQAGVILRLDHAKAAGDDEGVDRAAAASRGRLRHEPVPARADRDRPGLLGDYLDGVRVASRQRVGAGEHLGRADQIERLNPREGEDDDPSGRLGRCHGRIMA